MERFSSPSRREVMRGAGVLAVRTMTFAAFGRDLLGGRRGWAAASDPAWTTPLPPFRLVGNLYYVGSQDLAAYLVVTPAGNILINSNLQSSPPQIRRSVEQLGFAWKDTRVLLISHAHFDHAAGSARVVRDTGARYMVMQGDVPTVESGGAKDFAFSSGTHFPAAKVDRVLHDGDAVRLGGTVLIAHRTAGHTPGTTTWTMQVQEGDRALNVVIVGSWSVLSEYRLVTRRGRPASYPGIAEDYERSFALLKSLPCDVFLASHGSMFNLREKLARMPKEGWQVWVDPEGYRREVMAAEERFRVALQREKRG